MKVVVIIPAAGLGTRMVSVSDARSKKPAASKQFSEIGGTPILVHTLLKFAAVADRRGEASKAATWRTHAQAVQQAIDEGVRDIPGLRIYPVDRFTIRRC